MKKITLYFLIFLLPILAIGQADQMEKQTGVTNDSVTSLIPVSKQTLLRDVDVIFNTRMGFDSQFYDGNHDISKFTVNQFRFEIKGKIHEKVSFRFRNRYTREQVPGNLDNISRSVDLAFVKVDLSPNTNFTFGKLCADWGGYEFDFNPIDIMAYNDIIEYADNFLVGAGISHTLKNKKHTFTLQVLNSRTKTFEEQYGDTAPPDVEPSEYALAGVVNWRGSFFDGKLETTYSYSYFNEAKNLGMNYIALGHKFKPNNKFVLYYDFQYSDEGLDRKGIVSSIVNNAPLAPGDLIPDAVKGTRYIENWIRTEYWVTPKVNLLLTLMNSNHYWIDNPDPGTHDLLSISYGVIPEIQYKPFNDINLKFFVGYVYRNYDYTNYAEAYGSKDYTTGQLSFGIVAPLLVL